MELLFNLNLFFNIISIAFRLPRGSTDELQKEYEEAHHTTEDCEILYPECNETLLD